MPEGRLARARASLPEGYQFASGVGHSDHGSSTSAWLLDRIDQFDFSRECGDFDKSREVFLQVVNRCAREARGLAD